LVDLGGATGLPLPRALVQYLERRALRKLVPRYQGEQPRRDGETSRDLEGYGLDLGHARYRLREAGPLSDPCPLLALPDAGLSGLWFWPLLQQAQAAGRRVIAVDLPGFGNSRALRARPTPERLAWSVARLIAALRVTRVQLLGQGLGGVVARAVAERACERVASLATIDTPREHLEGPFLGRWRLGRRDPAALRAQLLAELPAGLDEPVRSSLVREIEAPPAARLRACWRALPVREDEVGPRLVRAALPSQPWLELSSAEGAALDDPEALLKALGAL
jgi:pimeloyl-ACP methyl ester carboxylesterase